MKNVVLAHFDELNERRFSSPWVCKMTEDGRFDFNSRVGCYTGNGRDGEEGDLVVFDPVEGQVYGYGQKDYRGNRTQKKFVLWDGEKFVPCDKLGAVKNEALHG